MKTKEEILGRPESLPANNLPDYLRSAYMPKKVLTAMDSFAKEIAIEFAKWVSSFETLNQCKRHFDCETNEQLFNLFKKENNI